MPSSKELPAWMACPASGTLSKSSSGSSSARASPQSTGVPGSSACGGVIKPDVVLYEESLDADVLNRAVQHLRRADLLLVGGTSLAVYPAAGLLQYYGGSRLVLLNKSATPYDANADLVLREPIGEVLGRIRVS